MKPWITTATLVVTGVAAAFAPQLTAFIAAHPAVAGVLAAIGGLIAHYIPSPLAEK